MNRDQKAAAIEEIATEIQGAEAIFAVDYRGISVPQAAELRARLREADATFKVVKNSLTERAADVAGAELLKELLSGPTALTFVRGDAALAAKAIADQARGTQLLPFKGGLMDGAALTGEQIGAIARLPARQVLHGQLVGLVASPLSGLVRTLNALIGGIAVQLGGVLEKKQSGEIAAGEPPPVAADAEAAGESPPAAPEDEAPAGEPPPAAAKSEAAAPPTDAASSPDEAEPADEAGSEAVQQAAAEEEQAAAAETGAAVDPPPTEPPAEAVEPTAGEPNQDTDHDDDDAVSAEEPAVAEAPAEATPGDDTEKA